MNSEQECKSFVYIPANLSLFRQKFAVFKSKYVVHVNRVDPKSCRDVMTTSRGPDLRRHCCSQTGGEMCRYRQHHEATDSKS